MSHSSTVMCIKFSPDGNVLASTGGDKMVYLYDIVNGTVVSQINHHSSYVGTCSFSRNGKFLATGSNDKQLVLWKLSSNDHTSFDSDSNTCSNTAHIHAGEAQESLYVRLENTNVEQTPVIENSHASILSEKDDVSLFRTIPSAHTSDINDLVFISNQRVVSVSSDKTIKLWSTGLNEDHPLKIIGTHRHPMYSLCCNGKVASLLATSALDGSIALWNSQTFEVVLAPFKLSKLGIRVCRSSNDGKKLILAGDDDGAYIWNIESGICERELFKLGHSNTVFMACFLTDTGSLAATGCNDGYLKIWNVDMEQVVTSVEEEAHDLGVVCGDVKPKPSDASDNNHSILATGGSDGLIKIWKISIDAESIGHCEYIQQLVGHGSTVMCVSFSPKTGKFLASTSGDKTVRLWNSESYLCLRVLEGIFLNF